MHVTAGQQVEHGQERQDRRSLPSRPALGWDRSRGERGRSRGGWDRFCLGRHRFSEKRRGNTDGRSQPPLGRSLPGGLLTPWPALVGLILALVGIVHPAGAASAPPAAPVPYGALPVYFEANHGQADDRFAFIARGQQHGVYLAPTEAVVTLARPDGAEARVFRLSLVGANPAATSAGQEPLPATVNYFLGNDPARWQRAVPTFGQVRFAAVYPGIDLLYHRSERQLEYDFIVAPGADPRAIALQFEGADRVRIGAAGELILESGDARVFQHRPIVYQTIAGARRQVAGRYELKNPRTVAFALGAYDTNSPLVIDPILSFATYLGGKKADRAWAIAVDGAGSAFIAGETLSVFKEVPPSGFQTNFAGGNKAAGDAFVAKLNPAGTAFEFLTYLGGQSLDGAVGLALDAAGNAYIAGYTLSADFPVTPGVVQPAQAGKKLDRLAVKPGDAFVAKLSASGSTLLYSTYLGGSSFDNALAIAVDAAGNALITGTTETAADYRVTNRVCRVRCTNDVCGPATCRTNVGKASEYFDELVVTNFISSKRVGTNMVGTNIVYTYKVVEEVVTTTLLGVQTLDAGFPVTNAAQPFHGGSSDAFLAKLNASATALIYCTYLGGAADEVGSGVAVDPAGNAYVAGSTDSPDFPVTAGCFQPFFGGGRNAFVTSLDPAGIVRYSTFLGGAGNVVAYRVAVDAAGSAYVTGAKNSTDFPTTPGAINRGGVFRTVDGAATWTPAGNGLTQTTIDALARTPGGDLLAATPRGVFRSADAGANWTVSFNTLTLGGVRSLASDATGTNLYAGTGAGLLISTNAGAGWFFEYGGLGRRVVSALAVTPGTIFAGTRGGGVLRSTNHAVSWQSANRGLGNLNVNAFAVHPLDASILYAATDRGVFRSTNSGLNWRGASTGLTTRRTRALAIDPSAPDTLYAGTPQGVFKTVNASNWVASSTGLPSGDVLALALDPASPSTLYAGTIFGLFKSTDAGAMWTTNRTGLVPPFVKTLLLDPASPGTLYAGLSGFNSGGGANDVFLTKLLPDGSGLAYSLAFGGGRNDQGWGVAVDAAGRAFVTGSTDSTNFPVANPTTSQQSTNSGKTDAFLTQFDAEGASMIYSIYLGGKRSDFAYALAVDGFGAAYLAGRTESTNLPTASPVQADIAGRPDAFIAKIIPDAMLRVARGAERVVVSWPGPLPGFALEGAENMSGPWTRVPQAPAFRAGWNSVTIPSKTACRFFRLKAE